MISSVRCAACVVASASALTHRQPTLPNIGWLGAGYDIFKGNPHSTNDNDPGFQGKVLQLSYNDGLKTDDLRYIIPDRTRGHQDTFCSSGFEASKIHGSKSLSDSFATEITANFGGFGAKFSASTDYKTVSKHTSSHDRLYSEAKASCSVYTIEAERYVPPTTTENFIKSVESLPASFNDDSAQLFYQFVESFGTHVTTAVEMGGHYGQRLEFTQDAWTTLHEKGLNVEAAASYAGEVSAGTSCDTQEQTNMAEEFFQSSLSVSTYYKGGQYKKSVEDWTRTVKDEPMPIKYTLSRLDEILTTSYMPGLDESILSSRQQGLKAAIDGYCQKLLKDGELSSCDGPPTDQPMEMRTNLGWSTENFRGHSNGMKQCPHSEHVTGIQWREQDGYGLVDLQVTCSDGTQWRSTGNNNGWWNTALTCPRGFSKVQGRSQWGYGIINFRAYCLYDTIEQDSNGQYGGGSLWEDETPCPEWAPVVVGFETQENPGHGIINFHPRCSNGVTTVVGEPIGHMVI